MKHKAQRTNKIIAFSGAAVLAIAGIGIIIAMAAVPSIQVEAERDQAPTAGAQVISDALASGAKAVLFGTVTTPTNPTNPNPTTPTTPPVATGAWLSGNTGDVGSFSDWRGRPADITGFWANSSTSSFDFIRNPDREGNVSNKSQYKGVWVGIPLVPVGASLTDCAAGNYNQHFTETGRSLNRLNRDNLFLRLGWESNGYWYNWSANWEGLGGNMQIEAFKQCFRNASQAIKAESPKTLIEWSMNRNSHLGSASVADMWPGDDVVDVVGVSFYDQWPTTQTQEQWNNDYMELQNGGPVGLGSWLAFAKAHGKRIAFPEWGVSGDGAPSGPSNNPVYIRNMYEFFATNAADIAYETYFNIAPGGQGNRFVINPPGNNVDAAAEYQRLWSQSPRP